MLLQPKEGLVDGQHYLMTTPDTCVWGWLPDRTHHPVLVDAVKGVHCKIRKADFAAWS